MESSISVRTPAKINLSLDIVGKRTDGYHFMKTVLQTVSVYDVVTLRLREDGQLLLSCPHCSHADFPYDENNLAVKAARAFYEATGTPFSGLEINLEKNIPLQAGLAGGSADAAGVLTALNALHETALTTARLCEIGVTLGADVPFCLTGGTALAEGIGEIILPLPNLPECYIVIAKGAAGVSTAEAFRKYDSILVSRRPDTDEMIAAVAVGNIPRVAELCCNVLENTADLADIQAIKSILLENGALCAQMTGSGSAVFGIFEKKRLAFACADELQKAFDYAVVCTPAEAGIEIL